MPNRPVAVDAWERSACYPRGSFYPLSYVHTTMQRRITLTCFRTCSTCTSRSQAGLSQYRFSTISIRTKPTFVHLRCHLGGDLPSQTAHQTMSFYRVFIRCRSNACSFQREVFHWRAKRSLLFSTVRKNLQMPSYSKAPGVFLSKDYQAASSQPSQFRRVCVQDSCSVILPFVRVGTHPTRNFAQLC